jgi:mRNA interferase YafQ
MSSEIQIVFVPSYRYSKKIFKLVSKNHLLQEKIENTLYKLAENPFDISLKTHKVESKICGFAFSSRVTGDLCIIWNFEDGNINIIDLLDIGGHSGSNSVY